MRNREQLLDLLGEFMVRIRDSGDLSLAWEPSVTAVAADLAGRLDETATHACEIADLAGGQDETATYVYEVNARYLLGWLRWYQAGSLPDGQRQVAINDALELMAPATVGISLLKFPPPLLPALADRAAPYLAELLRQAMASPDASLLADAAGEWTNLVNATPEGHPDLARRLSLLCGTLTTRYERAGDVADLDNAVDAGRRAITLGVSDCDWGMYLSNLSGALMRSYERTRDAADLDEAVAVARDAVSAAAGHEGLHVALTNLSGVLHTRFELSRRPEDVAEAVDASRRAVAARPDDPERAPMLHNLSRALLASFRLTESASDLDEAVDTGRLAVRAGEGRPDTDVRLSNLADTLRARIDLTPSDADTDEAITVLRRAIGLTPADKRRSRAERLMRLTACLSARATRTGDRADLDDMVSANRDAVRACPDGSARDSLLAILSTTLLQRYQQTRVAGDLDEAVAVARRAVTNATSADGGDRVFCLLRLDLVLWARYQSSMAPGDLDEAITVRRSIVEATPAGDAERSQRLSSLSTALLSRFLGQEETADLDEAAETLRAALDEAADGDERLYLMSDLASTLHLRFTRRETRADLEEAASLARDATAAVSPQTPPGLLVNLAVVLDARARMTGTLDDLDTAIRLVRRAATATAAHSPARTGQEREYIRMRVEGIWTRPAADQEPSHAEVLRFLGIYLTRRFEWTDVLADADAAIELRRQALTALGDGAERTRYLASLSYMLASRYRVSGERADLDEAVAAGREAAAAAPDNATHLALLSDTLRARFSESGDETELEEAVELARCAARLTPEHDDRRTAGLATLCQVLRTRYSLHPYLPDLDEAVNAARQALAAAGADDDERPKYLLVLGETLAVRVRDAGRRAGPRREADRAEALSVLSELTDSAVAPPWLRVYSAKIGAVLAVNDSAPGTADPALAADLLETAIRLLPEVAPRRMSSDQQRDAIEVAGGLASNAAAMALADETRPAPERTRRALSLLEAGRAVLLSQFLGIHGDLTELRRVRPDLAARFAALRNLLDTHADRSPLDRADRVETAAELDGTLREIRSLNGFAGFGLPPAADELLATAGQGPIVILNVAYRGDALLLTADGITPLPLPEVTGPAVVDQVNTFHVALREACDPAADRIAAQATLTGVLKWLWDHVTGPVLDALGYRGAPAREDTPLPRVWWAPGGYLGLLPLHAAGYHDDPGSGQTVMDRVVSSYTPTSGALRHARLRAAAGTAPADRALVVAAPKVPGLPELRNVPAETELLADVLADALTLTDPDRDRVLAELPGRSVAHFACHGGFNVSDPAVSGLLLRDHERHPLTVGDLGAVNLADAQLAYLSACHTAVNSADRLLDESMHLAGALQAAGFPHVVGTLWELDEEEALEITTDFYTWLRDPGTGRLDLGRAARSLHRATRRQRDLYPVTPSLWASHLHFGA
jgi:tetratricopeptide (TPR) repeat protein